MKRIVMVAVLVLCVAGMVAADPIVVKGLFTTNSYTYTHDGNAMWVRSADLRSATTNHAGMAIRMVNVAGRITNVLVAATTTNAVSYTDSSGGARAIIKGGTVVFTGFNTHTNFYFLYLDYE